MPQKFASNQNNWTEKSKKQNTEIKTIKREKQKN